VSRSSPRGPSAVSTLEEGRVFQRVVVSTCTFGPDFHQHSFSLEMLTKDTAARGATRRGRGPPAVGVLYGGGVDSPDVRHGAAG
jgi:hypothetical protein